MDNYIIFNSNNGIMTGRVSRVLSGRAGLPAVRGAAYHLGERQPELGAEHSVDDRVERRVEVAQP